MTRRLKPSTASSGRSSYRHGCSGELDDRPQVNVLVAPEWLAVRSAVLAALAPYPAARVAVANRLVMLDASAEAAL